ncbi:hypothetical protein, partial [Nocardia xishanensis]
LDTSVGAGLEGALGAGAGLTGAVGGALDGVGEAIESVGRAGRETTPNTPGRTDFREGLIGF